MRVCTHWEISQTRKDPGLRSELFGRETAKNREQQALNMVDRAGFGPATFRFLGQGLANRTFFGPIDGHTRLNYRPNALSEVRLRAR